MYIVSDIERIKKVIKKVLNKHKIKADISICNNYRAIMVCNDAENEDDILYIWIRILNIPNTNSYIIDISNICLPENKRRTGVFTNLYNELSKCKYVDKIRIISVCTYEMKNWCITNGLITYNDGNDYTN